MATVLDTKAEVNLEGLILCVAPISVIVKQNEIIKERCQLVGLYSVLPDQLDTGIFEQGFEQRSPDLDDDAPFGAVSPFAEKLVFGAQDLVSITNK